MTTFQTLSQDLSQIIDTIAPAVVAIGGGRRGRRGFPASGIHWRDGFVVTSAEAIPPKDSLILTLPDQSTCRADRIGVDPTTDIAVFKLPEDVQLPTLEHATDPANLGHLVVAVGRRPEQGTFANLGMISNIGGPWQSFSGGSIDQFIQVDVNLRRGGAGSALVNAQGQMIGFTTFGPRRTVLAIPAKTIDRVLQQLQEKGRVARGYLGLGMQPVELPKTLREQHGLANCCGIMIVSVEADQAADLAGIVLGDILVTINEQPVQDPREIQDFLAPQMVGKPLKVQLIRGGGLQPVEITVGER